MAEKQEILQVGPMLHTCEAALESLYAVHRLDKGVDLAAVGPRIRAVATEYRHGCSAELLAQLPNVGVVANFGVGYDSVDVAACRARGIRVTNTPDVLNDAVAELTVGLMIALARRIPEGDRFVRDGKWLEGPMPLASELTGATVGILGLGRIGKEIARRLQVFKMKVVYHGRTRQAFEPFEFYPDLETMAAAVDWLVVIAPGSAETRGIVSCGVMTALGPEGRLVNVARGSLVDEDAMFELLKSRALGGAALDDFEEEPARATRIGALDNVVLAPHVGSATNKTRQAMGDLVVRNLEAFFRGEPLPTQVV